MAGDVAWWPAGPGASRGSVAALTVSYNTRELTAFLLWSPPSRAGRFSLVPAEVLVRRYPFPQNAISVAFLTSSWKAAVPVPAGGGTLFL